MDRILRGIVKFRNSLRTSLLPVLKDVAITAKPDMLMITCVDSRLMPCSYTSAVPGQMFIVRNVGNLFPHARLFGSQVSSNAEPAALELAVVNYGIKHVAVCGHSDCKAMHALYDTSSSSATTNTTSMITSWISTHGKSSLTKLDQLIVSKDKPVKLVFSEDNGTDKFEATIDENLMIQDKLSQINVLQQLHNISSYSFVRDRLRSKEIKLHGLWFDIANGEMHMFSKETGAFELITENTLDDMLKSV